MIPMSTSTHHRAVLLKNHERNTSARVVVRRAEEQKPKLKKAVRSYRYRYFPSSANTFFATIFISSLARMNKTVFH